KQRQKTPFSWDNYFSGVAKNQSLNRKEHEMYQKIFIIGNLGKDPEMRYTPSGQAVTSFSVATNRQYTDSSGQRVKETIWFRVSAWGRQAESCNQYLHRGSKVMVEGRLTADPATGGPKIWTRQDGTAGASFEITTYNVQFLSTRAEDEQYQQSNTPPTNQIAEPGEENIPF
ncbi:MAG: single-stranded DNA-binding protein, partial [Anaerolineales bacterium]